MFDFLNKKKKVEKLRKEVQDSFGNVKEDIAKVGDWIKHIDAKSQTNEKDISSLKDELGDLNEALQELKSQISFLNSGLKQKNPAAVQEGVKTQTNSAAVQSAVQTAVQTGNLDHLTMMERAIVFILLNNDDKLSYEDISLMLGKVKSTVRGQINSIKQKNPGLINEFRELNGKKRLYIEGTNKDLILKSVKVRVKEDKNLLKK
jgi:septal ring factor EnvC (AmiA/AmiB activator)